MDERLEKALDTANYLSTLHNQKLILKEKFEADVVHYFNGGQFSATSDRIAFCHALAQNNQKEVILVDDADNPVQIEDIETFTKDLIDTYSQASNRYHTEYAKIKSKRKIEDLVSL